jgi:hypothetical protein
MKNLKKWLWFTLLVPLVLAACGDDDTDDQLDIADPAVRFVHASPLAPNVTLYRGTTAQPDATDVPYSFASNYYDTSSEAADWSVRTTADDVTIGTVTINPSRGNRYTLVAIPASETTSAVAMIEDPYNKPLNSNNARLRLFNAAFKGGTVDVYLTTPGTDIAAAGVNPSISGVAYQAAGPASTLDSIDLPGGSYTLTVTTAGTKTELFTGPFNFNDDQDILLLTVPDGAEPGSISVLAKTEGTAGAVEVPPSP